MAEVKLQAVKREVTGKGAARKARAEGKVPGVIYGQGMDPVAVEVERRALINAFHTDAGTNVLLKIKLDGKETTALARDLQRDPVRGTLLHADFVKIDLKQEVQVEVPVHLVGEAAGVKEGGVLEQPLFSLQVKCLPTDVPEAVEAHITALTIGDSLKVADLVPDGKYEILTDPEATVASVAAPISEAQLEAMEAAAGVELEAPEEEAEVEAAEAAAEGEIPEGAPEAGKPEGGEQSPGGAE
ncbi:MAG: 50S ribosomal protein L25/general stress protein Ctc [Actinomycetota bacterium]|nr:50S ribosomal protein L25/general stress protein Ctc [Actinomycetota bacterium]